MKEAVDDIMVTLNEAASEGGMVGGMVESIAEAMGRVSRQPKENVIFQKSFRTQLLTSVLQKWNRWKGPLAKMQHTLY